jgi:hypothetical protein
VATKTPKRPTSVPPDARWQASASEWEQGTVDARGLKQGPFTSWRADGSKCNECSFKDGKPHGAFTRFHESGAISQEGTFVNGALHGTRRWRASDEPTTERMHEPDVSAEVRSSEMDYQHGRVTGVRHFDAGGRRVTPQGERYPELPAGVDEAAEFHPDREVWTVGPADERTGERMGRWRSWNADGRLTEDAQYEQGLRHGAVREFVTDPNPFADERVACEAGICEHGVRVGIWEFFDAKRTPLSEIDYGRIGALELRALEAWSNEARTDWGEKGLQLLAQGQVRAGLVTLARACAVARSTAPLEKALEQHARALKPEAARAFANQADEDLPSLATALLDGCSVAHTLRKLAVTLDHAGQSRAALDFVNAALLFAPTELGFLFTRGLVLMSLGLKAQAERDAADLATASAEQARFLRDYLALLFPTFSFWPSAEPKETSYDGLPEAPVKGLGEVQVLVQKLATRLGQVRAALLTMVTEASPWLVPDVSELLPEGPVPLEHGAFDRANEAGEEEEVTFDERLDLEGVDLPSLVRLARADWASLTWLLWAAGEATVTLPTTLAPPAEFPLAAGMMAQRLWRARDQRTFHGRNARTQGIPGFDFEGHDVAELHPNLAGIAEQQYAELQALFHWLSQETVRSPWQDDLRGS